MAAAAALVAAGSLAVSFQQIVGERDRAEVARVEASERANDVLLEQAMSQLQTSNQSPRKDHSGMLIGPSSAGVSSSLASAVCVSRTELALPTACAT